MSAFWGSATSVLIGLSDLLLVRVNNRMHIVTLMIAAMAGGVAVALVGTVVVDGDPQLRSVLLGCGAGLAMGAALACYVTSLVNASVSITSPIVAVQNALWPFLFAVLVDGDRPSGPAWAGVVVALVSLVLTTSGRLAPMGDLRRGLWLAGLSGLLYGVGSTLFGKTAEASGMWPAVGHRVTALMAFLAAAALLGVPRLAPQGTRVRAIAGGAVGTLAVMCYLIGTQRGSLAIVAVTASMFPAVSAGLLNRFAGHPIRWWQAVGIGGAITGIALIAVG